MPMTPLPTLDRTSATFKTDVDDFFATDLPLFVTEANTLETTVEGYKNTSATNASTSTTKANEAAASASTANAAATTAVSAASASVWISGTTYALYDTVISPSDYQTYRRKIAGAGTTDPSADSTNWEIISTNVTATSITTFSNKTLTSPIINSSTIDSATINGGYTEEVYAVSGTTPALSPTNGTIQTWTLTGNSTPTAGSWTAGQNITLMIDDGTDYTINWTSLAVTWKTDAGSAPTLNTSGYTAIALWKVGTTIYGARVGDA